MKKRHPTILTLTGLLTVATAQAHVGPHDVGHGIVHFLSQPDHVLALVLGGGVAGGLVVLARRWLSRK